MPDTAATSVCKNSR